MVEEAQAKLHKVLEKAAGLVTPSEDERKRLESVSDKIREKLEATFGKVSVAPEIRLGGSFAKGTWLKGSADIDLFLLYPAGYPREKLEGEAINASKKAVEGYRVNMRFAEHPYVEAIVDGARLNLVPCYKVAPGEWQSAADRSPYHTEYMLRKFDDRLRLETRLLKRFAKSAGVYGAEVKVQGLSGYVCEVLTLNYESFESTLAHLSTINRGEILSLEPYDKDLAASFTSPLVILDPVDTTRNLGTAISTQNLSRLIIQCRNFLAKPSINYFVEEDEKEEKEMRRRPPAKPRVAKRKEDLLQRTLIILFRTQPRSVDILWGQLRKSIAALTNKIELMGFTVLRARASSDERGENAFIFLLLETRISKYQQRTGPDVFRKDDFAKYVERNQGRALLSWLDNEGRIISLFEKKERDSIDAFKALSMVLKDVKARETIGLSKAVKEEMSAFRITNGAQAGKNRPWLVKDILSIVSEERVLQDAETA